MNKGYPKLFNKTNPNVDIFVIQGEEGTDSIMGSDMRHSMIGDATLKHESYLGNRRLTHDEYIHFADGNLVRMEDNPFYPDLDAKPNDEADTFLDEKGAQIEEGEEDLFSKGMQALISVEDHEKGIKVDDAEEEFLPATPKPMFKFAGDSRQIFYDDFSWPSGSTSSGHPQSEKVQIFLGMIRNNIHRYHEPYIHTRRVDGQKYLEYHYYATWGDYLLNIIEGWAFSATIDRDVEEFLVNTANYIAEVDPCDDTLTEFISEQLQLLDDEYGAEVRFQALAKSLLSNKAYAMLQSKEYEFDRAYSEGTKSKVQILKEIGKIGSELYIKEFNPDDDKYGRINKSQTAWWKYNNMKRKFAPCIIIEGINVNRCYDKNVLCDQIGFTEEQAKAIVSHLFENTVVKESKLFQYNNLTVERGKTRLKGGIFKDVAHVFQVAGMKQSEFIPANQRKELDKVFNIINEGFKKALRYKNIRNLTRVPPMLIGRQNNKEIDMERSTWQAAWKNYNKKKEEAKVLLAK